MSPYRPRKPVVPMPDDESPADYQFVSPTPKEMAKRVELPPPDIVHEDRVLPSDAEPLELVVERRYKHLICQSMHPKDLAAALAGAAKWVAIKRGLDEQQGWGSHLKETVSDG